jgi:flagellar biosynthesis activator protein FlaF
MSIDAYRRQQEIAETPRETERRALSMVIGKLLDAKEQGGAALTEACYLNERLWNIFRADLSVPENGLPAPLKAQLLSLALWVQRYTSQVIRGEADPDPLIAVNRSIYEGLAPPARPVSAAAPVISESL